MVSLDIAGIQTVAKNSWPCRYFLCLAFSAAEFASAAALARVVGLIFNTAQAVPTACPAASSPSFVTCPACSPYLQWWKKRPSIFSFLPIILKKRIKKTGHKHYILAKTRFIPNMGDSSPICTCLALNYCPKKRGPMDRSKPSYRNLESWMAFWYMGHNSR